MGILQELTLSQISLMLHLPLAFAVLFLFRTTIAFCLHPSHSLEHRSTLVYDTDRIYLKKRYFVDRYLRSGRPALVGAGLVGLLWWEQDW